jgi:hypothetical protein
MQINKKMIARLAAFFIIILFINLPFSSALTISEATASEISDTGARVSWKTDQNSTGAVSYGKDKILSFTKSDPVNTTAHTVLLTGLENNKTYYFSIASTTGRENATDNNNNNYYSFFTGYAETAAVFVEANIPSYVSTKAIDIAGRTKPLSKIYLYVNGVAARKIDLSESGNFTFNKVELLSFKTNTIMIEATDKSGAKAAKSYDVVVDTVAPVLTFAKTPAISRETSLVLNGTVSEPATVEFFVNGNSVSKKENVNSFSESIAVKEGQNDIMITATDRAGNADTKRGTLNVDTKPPVIEKISPKSGSFFYEGAAETDIEGKTEPHAKIDLYISDNEKSLEAGKSVFTVEADDDGNFKFEKINIEKGGIAAAGYVGYSAELEGGKEKYEQKFPPVVTGQENISAQTAYTRGKPEEQTIFVRIVATDKAGLRAAENLNYRLGTCFSGNMDWNVLNMVEFQNPTMLSPERLEEGTELTSFILNISYQGLGTNPIIKEVLFARACESQTIQEQDDRYKYGCKVLPTNPIKRSNPDKTLWYIRYNLKSLKEMGNFTDIKDFNELIKDLSTSFILPLKITINYEHEVDGQKVQGSMTKCLKLSYNIDTSRIDPRDVLPDWLRTKGIRFINESINNLNKIIPQIEKINRYVAIACIVGVGLRAIATISRRFAGYSDYIGDKALAPSAPDKCPPPGDIFKTDFIKGSEVDSKTKDAVKFTQADLTNEELKIRCPAVSAAWEREALSYKALRWSCDRFFCHGTAARWTEQAIYAEAREVYDETIWQNVRDGLNCVDKTGTKGIFLKEDLKCKQATGKECYVYENRYYARNPAKEPEAGTEPGEDYFYLQQINPNTGQPTLSLEKDLKVLKKGKNAMLKPEGQDTCAKLCAEKGFKSSKCITIEDFNPSIYNEAWDPRTHTASKVTPNSFFKTDDCFEKQQLCYCYTVAQKGPKQDISGEWNYRYDKTKMFAYPRYLYYDGRDKSACFGQNNWLFQSAPYIDASGELWASFQCLCITQIRNRLVLLRSILQGVLVCLQQIEKNGKANAGVCKEIFTQYICKWMSYLVTYFMKGCMPWKGLGGDAGIGDWINAGADSVFGGVKETTNDLLDDYDNAALENYLGASENNIAEKICLGALTGDWGMDFEGLLDAAYSIPFHSTATAFPATREFLTFNPDNNKASYEYAIAYMIAPGCHIDGYRVSLTCVTDYELYNYDGVACIGVSGTISDDSSPEGCDCTSSAGGQARWNQAAPFPVQKLVKSGGALEQASFADSSVHSVEEQDFRYDHVKIELLINDPKVAKDCIPEENLKGRMGVFYAPISDRTTQDIAACRFDQSSASFRCGEAQLLWDPRGTGSIGYFNYKPDYYVGDSIDLEVPVTVQGKKQCLFATLTNGRGSELNKKIYPVLPEVSEPTDFRRGALGLPLGPNLAVTRTATVPIPLLPRIDVSHFQSTGYSFGFDKGQPAGMVAMPNYDQTTTFAERTYKFYIRYSPTDATKKQMQINIEGNTGFGGWEDLITLDDPNKLLGKPYFIGGKAYGFGMPPTFAESTEGAACFDDAKIKCMEYSLKISKPTITSVGSQKWKIKLELRHAPQEGEGDCEYALPEDVIKKDGIAVAKELLINVSPKTIAEVNTCYTDGIVNNNQVGKSVCDCDGNGKTDDDGVDCSAEKGRYYCYVHADKTIIKCERYRICKQGQQLSGTDLLCDCNLDGNVDGNDCTTAKDYCYEKTPLTKVEYTDKFKAVQAAAIMPKISSVSASYATDGATTILQPESVPPSPPNIITFKTNNKKVDIKFVVATLNIDKLEVKWDSTTLNTVSKTSSGFEFTISKANIPLDKEIIIKGTSADSKSFIEQKIKMK